MFDDVVQGFLDGEKQVPPDLARNRDGQHFVREFKAAAHTRGFEQLGGIGPQVRRHSVEVVIARVGCPDQFADAIHQPARQVARLAPLGPVGLFRARLPLRHVRQHRDPRQVGGQAVVHVAGDAGSFQIQRV